MKGLLWLHPIMVVWIFLWIIIWVGNYFLYGAWLPLSIVWSLLAVIMTYCSLFYGCLLWIVRPGTWPKRAGALLLLLFFHITIYDVIYGYVYDFLPRMGVIVYDPSRAFDPIQFNRRILEGLSLIWLLAVLMCLATLYRYGLQRQVALNQRLDEMSNRFSSAEIYPHFVQSVTASVIGERLFGSTRQRSMEYLHAVMRYVLKVQQESDVLVTLQEEWEYARKLLEVARSHYGSTQIQWDVSGKIPKGMHTVPMVLITFIENSLKHSNPGEHVSIKVRLEVSEAGFVFTCVNPLARSTIPASGSQEGGFGISNLQDRIDQSGFPIHIHAASEQRNFIARVTKQAKNETP